MKPQASFYFPIRLSTGVALMALLSVSVWQSACERSMTTHTYNCRDRKVDVDSGAATGVVQDAVVICGGQQLDWKEKHTENWVVDFTSSPFEQGEMQIKKGGPPHSKVKHLTDDTGFKYSITVDGTKHDPQIIIMGGT